jgi:hydroxymethylpyrimidine pyrophosphatase-like HAD family hydrolase
MPLTPLGPAAHHLAPVRLVATDMDGTMTVQERFTPELLQTLQQLAAAPLPVIVVTGRSAGWVSAIGHYLPVVGAIAENGGIFYQGETSQFLGSIGDVTQHRHQLADMFAILKAQFPTIEPSSDNPFRLTDWTFNVAGLSLADLQIMAQLCEQRDWSFTYSTVQCHIKPIGQSKAHGLQQVIQQLFPTLACDQVVTVGDSPNDESMFNPALFPVSVGVANVAKYAAQMQFQPQFITAASEGQGFGELAALLLAR